MTSNRDKNPMGLEIALRFLLRFSFVAGALIEAVLAIRALWDWNLGLGVTLGLGFFLTCHLASNFLEETLRSLVIVVRLLIGCLDVLLIMLAKSADFVHDLFSDRKRERSGNLEEANLVRDLISERMLVTEQKNMHPAFRGTLAVLAATFVAALVVGITLPHVRQYVPEELTAYIPFQKKWIDPWDGANMGGEPPAELDRSVDLSLDPSLPMRHWDEWRYGNERLSKFGPDTPRR